MNRIILGIALVAVLPFAGVACHHSVQRDAGAQLLDWQTSPLDLNLRGLNGRRYMFHCPPGEPEPGLLTGDIVYTDSSSICTAAVHTGVIAAGNGGDVVIEILPGQTSYLGSTRNAVHSSAYSHSWVGSFAVLDRPPHGSTM